MEKSIEIYLKGSELGYADSKCELAQIYEKNNNFDETIKWYNIAAEQNHAHSQYALGFIYEIGQNNVKQNNEIALKWYLLAANNGSGAAQNELRDAYFYRHKEMVEVNYVEAVKWYAMAIKTSLKCRTYYLAISSLQNLIECYRSGGYGLVRDKKKVKQLQIQYKEIEELEKREEEGR